LRKRPLILASVLAVATLLLSACSGSNNSASTSTGGSSFGEYEKDKAGGIVTFVASAAGGTLDPKVNYTAQYLSLIHI
jgi:peptide/nickel transport system substrate-binding protein